MKVHRRLATRTRCGVVPRDSAAWTDNPEEVTCARCIPPRWHVTFLHERPWKRAHCVVHAWAHVAGLDGQSLLELRSKALRAGLLDERGAAYGSSYSPAVERWAQLAGMRIVKTVWALRVQKSFGRPDGTMVPCQLQRFAREHPTGRYVVWVARHAVAVINGTIYGAYRPATRVLRAALVEKEESR